MVRAQVSKLSCAMSVMNKRAGELISSFPLNKKRKTEKDLFITSSTGGMHYYVPRKQIEVATPKRESFSSSNINNYSLSHHSSTPTQQQPTGLNSVYQILFADDCNSQKLQQQQQQQYISNSNPGLPQQHHQYNQQLFAVNPFHVQASNCKIAAGSGNTQLINKQQQMPIQHFVIEGKKESSSSLNVNSHQQKQQQIIVCNGENRKSSTFCLGTSLTMLSTIRRNGRWIITNPQPDVIAKTRKVEMKVKLMSGKIATDRQVLLTVAISENTESNFYLDLSLSSKTSEPSFPFLIKPIQLNDKGEFEFEFYIHCRKCNLASRTNNISTFEITFHLNQHEIFSISAKALSHQYEYAKGNYENQFKKAPVEIETFF